MSYLKFKRGAGGFTLIELLVGMVIAGIITTALYTFFNTSLRQYFALEQDGLAFGDIAAQSQRVARVLRGLTDITQAESTETTVYAYFSPNDANVSLIRYYKNAAGTQLLADVTPMTSNPPIGTPITANEKTYTIIDSFYSAPGVSTFEYLDSAGNPIALPISDLHTIKGMRVNLAVPTSAPSSNGSSSVSLQVSLRNRKTNL